MLVITLFLWTLLCGTVHLVVVEVQQGKLDGELRDRSTGNGKVHCFKGIPFAAPPVGKLRFRAPHPPLPWECIRDAKEHGPVCPQININTGEYVEGVGDEDCLYLNVYVPQNSDECDDDDPELNPKANLAVMFYVHGGVLVSGSGNDDYYGPDFILDHNVILVTTNYRLGPLGGLCLNIKEVPGNAGMKDIIAAGRWVKKNIKQFGGDPNNISIFGHSAGSSIVTFMALSPMATGLFRRGIALSGTCLNDYITSYEPKRHSMLLAHRLGHYTQDPYKAYKFLLNATVEDLMTATPNVLAIDQINGFANKYHTFPPVVEKYCGDEHFLLESPETQLIQRNTNNMELIIGLTSKEGTGRVISQKEYIFDSYPYYKEMLIPTKIYPYLPPNRLLVIADYIQNHYFGEKAISEKNIAKFIEFYSYFVFGYDVYRFLEMWIKAGRYAFFYEFNCFTERNLFGQTGVPYEIKEATHLDDTFYIFDGKATNLTLDKTKPSYKMIVQFCKLITNFAKQGNPTPDCSLGVTWPYYNFKYHYFLNIKKKLKVESVSKHKNEIDFWRSVFSYSGRLFS